RSRCKHAPLVGAGEPAVANDVAHQIAASFRVSLIAPSRLVTNQIANDAPPPRQHILVYAREIVEGGLGRSFSAGCSDVASFPNRAEANRSEILFAAFFIGSEARCA